MGAWGSWVIDGGLWPVMVVCGSVMVDCGSVRVAEENKVVEKDGERKAERMGLEAMESSVDMAVAMLVVVVEKMGLVKVERRWRGEGLDLWSGDASEAFF